MFEAIIAAIITLIVSFAGVSIMGEMFLYLGLPPILIGTIVGVGTVLYNKLDDCANEVMIDKKEIEELIKLRDMELLSDIELEEVIELYESRNAANAKYEQYQNGEKVFNELKVLGYLTQDQYTDRLNGLKKHFYED
ncbi:hypothetical protein [Sinanaerobacter chloroacetimidivorans]|uniref:Uncharacterized protein n=1 Tax=Sinanaerobacter chloroacetimidivorans TaxID=2818044 RepID=A0A8J7VXM6_9FIRM|nr:hypothetical protein [Sinanaerobacter chloroacetimidivorans]MBR0596937.1 hypothetical protein [Sinanaerobacter chloroacetimidivorans]